MRITIPKKYQWKCYHFIHKNLIMRNGQKISLGEHIHEDNIGLCACGLHASLSVEDAMKYKPSASVLTEVLVFGTIIIAQDKLVATDRITTKILTKDLKGE